MSYRLGIDVGGTNTDAVILDDNDSVLTSTKTHTTPDVESGIYSAVDVVLSESGIDPTSVTAAMLGTTQATNAIVERKQLARVGVVRLGYPATAAIPPYTEWPKDLVNSLTGQYQLVHGGYEYDGQLLTPIDEDELRTTFQKWSGKVDSVAIVGVFSALNRDQEERAADIAREELGEEISVSLSSKIGSIGLITRENATILNAGLYQVISRVTKGFSAALKAKGVVNAQVYLCQNDGTLMSLEYAAKYPILTIGSGPTNSIRGASYLSKRRNALVLDIGGTTSDLGVLVNDFPRESSKAVSVGGVQTNFRMPDILSIGLGGGSIVRQLTDGSVTVGPDSVGYAITAKALCFGGDTITATDIAVRLGKVKLGNPKLTDVISLSVAHKAVDVIQAQLANAVDKMKTSAEPVDLVLVGGGAIIATEAIAGTKKTFTSALGGVANAIGATIAQIGGQSERLYQYVTIPREEAITATTEDATRQAVEAGADQDTVQVVDVEEVPLQYAPGDSTRVKVKVVGNMV